MCNCVNLIQVMFYIKTISYNSSFKMFKSQKDKSENITKEDFENMVSVEFNDFQKDNPFPNGIDNLFQEIIHNLLQEFKDHIIKLVSEEFQPYFI